MCDLLLLLALRFLVPMSKFSDSRKKLKEFKNIKGVSITERRGLLRVKLSAKVTGDKPVEKTFKALADALDFVELYTARHDKLVKDLAALSYEKGYDAVAALKLLDTAGMAMTLVEVCRDYIAHKQASEVGVPMLMGAALDEYMAEKEDGVGAKTYATYKAYEASLRLLYADILVSDVGEDEITEWLEVATFKKSHGTYNRYLSFATSFFRWSMKKSYCVSNPCEDKTMYTLDDATPSVLTVEEVELVLRCLKDHEMNELLLGFHIQLFAGLRLSEALRITWSCINEDFIKLEKKHTKTKKGRAIPLHPNLKKHLDTNPHFLNPASRDEP
jgi:hypothetical protein